MPTADSRSFGCAVIDKDTKNIVEGARIKRLVFSFNDGGEEEPVLEEAPAGDPWHVYTFLNVARAPELAGVKGDATAMNQDVAMASTDFGSYDPENLGPTLVERPLTLTPVGAFPSAFMARDARAVDFDPTTSWSVTKDESALISWVAFDLNGTYQLRRIDLDFCEGTDNDFEIVGTQKESSLSLHSDAVQLFYKSQDLKGPVRLEIDPKDQRTAFHYLKFSVKLVLKTSAVCLNGINVYGDRVDRGKGP